MRSHVLSGKKLVFAPILRAGMGFLEGMLDLVPSARVAHIGLYRDPESLVAVEYYFKAPTALNERLVVAVDPMLATGNTAVAAMERLKEHGASELRFVCLLATEAGLKNLHRHHPEVPVWTAAIDERLNEHGYILPGLGDAGDRLYGTR
jgi:uracil phosphoribosyltransferase